MRIHKITCGILEENCYICYDEESREGYVIDPGEDSRRYLEFIGEKNIKVKAVLLTHHHSDHSGAAKEVAGKLNVKTLIHEDDILKYSADDIFKDGDRIGSLTVIHTPGHTAGSVCFYDEEEGIAFTGDTVFNVDLGRTDFSDGSPAQMTESVLKLDRMWNDEIRIYPGHGGDCTMEYVRKNNREFLEIVL